MPELKKVSVCNVYAARVYVKQSEITKTDIVVLLAIQTMSSKLLLVFCACLSYALADFVSQRQWVQPNQLYPNGLSYEQSITAIAQNQVVFQDGSQGTAWFNTTGYCLKDFEFREIGYHAVVTYGSYNYLNLLVKLADEALGKGFHGDYVFLLFKFHHEGRELPTGIRRYSPMVHDMAKSLDMTSIFKTKRDVLMKFLKGSTNVEIIKELYDFVASERRTRLMRFSRSLTRKIGKMILDHKEDSVFYVFVRYLGVPFLSHCIAHSMYHPHFVSFDQILLEHIEECKNSKESQYFRHSCSIKLILPRKIEIQGKKCY